MIFSRWACAPACSQRRRTRPLPSRTAQDKWSAAYSVRTLLISLQSLLGEPNNDSPLNGYAAQLWDSQEEYREVMVKKYKEASA